MTTNQINYQKHVEERRHNRTVERETKRANLEQAFLQLKSINESIRHNQAYESFQTKQLAESNRHNLETEKLGILNYGLDSSKRDILQQQADIQAGQLGVAQYNAATNRIATDNTYKTQMAGIEVSKANVQESIRHNTVSEAQQKEQITNSYDLGLRNNAANIMVHTQQQLLQNQSLSETSRHNQTVESETKRQNTISNLFRLGEQVSSYVKPALGLSKAAR